jgi:hypothetical protein
MTIKSLGLRGFYQKTKAMFCRSVCTLDRGPDRCDPAEASGLEINPPNPPKPSHRLRRFPKGYMRSRLQQSPLLTLSTSAPGRQSCYRAGYLFPEVRPQAIALMTSRQR